jgi:hypothetical protein
MRSIGTAAERTPEPDTAATATATSSEQARRRRRPRAEQIDRGYRREYLDMDSDPEHAASALASGQGAEPLGFAGTADGAGAAQAGGLTG